jgi:hypothetical protein
MSRGAWIRTLILAVADAIVFALTIRAHLTWHRTRGGPTFMDFHQVLGWIASFGLLLALAFSIFDGVDTARHLRRN